MEIIVDLMIIIVKLEVTKIQSILSSVLYVMREFDWLKGKMLIKFGKNTKRAVFVEKKKRRNRLEICKKLQK